MNNTLVLVLHILILMCAIQLSSSFYDDYFLLDFESEGSNPKNRPKVPADYNDPAQRPKGYTCGVCVVVDEEFAQAYNVTSIQKFIEHANWVFRNVDWNRNGRPDNIGFRTSKISYGWKPYENETPEHYDTPKPAIELLKLFARLNFSSCCLGIGFTNRPFENGLDGIAFAASDRLLGGICDHRNPSEEYMINMNVVLISGRGLENPQLTPSQIAKSLLHELGHSFGVHTHDNEYKDPQCWGFRAHETPTAQNIVPSDGRYIMWGNSVQGNLTLKKNTLQFSACSKIAVSNIVSKRKLREKCFELDYNSFCGNGIVEGVEMCDCGNEYECATQKCCGSRKSKSPCVVDSGCGVAARKSVVGAGERQTCSWAMIMFYVIAVSK